MLGLDRAELPQPVHEPTGVQQGPAVLDLRSRCVLSSPGAEGFWRERAETIRPGRCPQTASCRRPLATSRRASSSSSCWAKTHTPRHSAQPQLATSASRCQSRSSFVVEEGHGEKLLSPLLPLHACPRTRHKGASLAGCSCGHALLQSAPRLGRSVDGRVDGQVPARQLGSGPAGMQQR